MQFIQLLTIILVALAMADDIPTYSLKDGYALLVAGSSGIWNYRHQADVAHSYHLLISKGMPASHIVVMMFDDIANNPSNPNPGTIMNVINGTDLYPGLKIDYRGDDVNIYTFRDVLIGNKDAVKGKGTGRVVESTKNDNVFLYYSDHGAVGFVSMPSGPVLYRSFLQQTIQEATFHDMVVYIESCESGSMFEGLEDSTTVFGLSASMGNESSWATQCVPGGICYADEFSLNWIQDSEQYNLNLHHLENQFVDVRAKTRQSTVCQFGSSSISENVVSQYQGNKLTGGKVDGESSGHVQEVDSVFSLDLTIPARETPVFYFQGQALHAKTVDERMAAELTLEKIYQNRQTGRDFLLALADEISTGLSAVSTRKSYQEILSCYESVLMELERNCIDLATTPYLTSMVSIFKSLAELHDCEVIKSNLNTACSKRTMLKNIL